jgi:hypothetical protein
VPLVSEVGIPGQGTNGVNACVALTVINMRLGTLPVPVQVVPQVIEVPSAHSQLGGKALGKVRVGPEATAL